jgi:hypothetical protein
MIWPSFEKIISVPGLIMTLKFEGIKIGLSISIMPVLKIILSSCIFKKVFFFKSFASTSYNLDRWVLTVFDQKAIADVFFLFCPKILYTILILSRFYFLHKFSLAQSIFINSSFAALFMSFPFK